MSSNGVSNSSIRVDQLTLTQNVQDTDSLLIVTNPTDVNLKQLQRVSVSVLYSNTDLVIKNTTPANSTVNAIPNSIWVDSNYLYVAISNNVIKRVALSSF